MKLQEKQLVVQVVLHSKKTKLSEKLSVRQIVELLSGGGRREEVKTDKV